jgi:hypothetical protein
MRCEPGWLTYFLLSEQRRAPQTQLWGLPSESLSKLLDRVTSCPMMVRVFVLISLGLIGLSACQGTRIVHSDPKAIWAHTEYAEYERGMKDAISMIQAGRIIIPLGGSYGEARLHRVLKKRYGIEVVDGREWSRGYGSAYNQAMRHAANNRFGAEWWPRALKEAGVEIPLPTSAGHVSFSSRGVGL